MSRHRHTHRIPCLCETSRPLCTGTENLESLAGQCAHNTATLGTTRRRLRTVRTSRISLHAELVLIRIRDTGPAFLENYTADGDAGSIPLPFWRRGLLLEPLTSGHASTIARLPYTRALRRLMRGRLSHTFSFCLAINPAFSVFAKPWGSLSPDSASWVSPFLPSTRWGAMRASPIEDFEVGRKVALVDGCKTRCSIAYAMQNHHPRRLLAADLLQHHTTAGCATRLYTPRRAGYTMRVRDRGVAPCALCRCSTLRPRTS
ncbi:hypothetical protein B0H19DRAFT_448670 [Mycena capillaripes]|nr:hypothetical protein B0H19DRAFT_448670 [Mycena capillaripes]